MHHSIPLITTLAIALGLALLFGYLSTRLKLPVIVGYLLAGTLIGPHTPGFVAHTEITRELSEIAVMLLMFGVGLNLSIEDLLEVRRIALPGATLQIVVATILGAGIAYVWGWNIGGCLIFGLSLSVASTVVLLRALESHNMINSINGRIAIGWLIVEDLAMVLVLVLLPPFAAWINTKEYLTEINLWQSLGLTMLKITIFITLMIVIGRKIFPKILWAIAYTGSRELFTLCVVAAAITLAYFGSILFGVSFALGAFFAGMTMRESPLSHRAAEESLPLREAFAVLFFVSVGMLFDPVVLIHHPFQILAVVIIIIFGKTIAAGALVLLFRYPFNTALIVSASLAQIGEFSFILADMGVDLGLLLPEAQSLILAGALISIALNPLLFSLVKPLQAWLKKRTYIIKTLDQRFDAISKLPRALEKQYWSNQIVLIGYGRVGKRVGETLAESGISYIVIEEDREIINRLRRKKIPAFAGDATQPEVLIKAHIQNAAMVVIATPDTVTTRHIIRTVRTLNPKIELLIRTHSEEEANLLKKETESRIFFGERELAKSISNHVLKNMGHHL